MSKPTTTRAGGIRTSDLSARQLRLVRLMASLQFGAIENLRVGGGEPVFDPPPQVVREVKFGAESVSTASAADFEIKRQVLELLDELRRIGDGIVDRMEIRHGLPHRMVVTVRGVAGQ